MKYVVFGLLLFCSTGLCQISSSEFDSNLLLEFQAGSNTENVLSFIGAFYTVADQVGLRKPSKNHPILTPTGYYTVSINISESVSSSRIVVDAETLIIKVNMQSARNQDLNAGAVKLVRYLHDQNGYRFDNPCASAVRRWSDDFCK